MAQAADEAKPAPLTPHLEAPLPSQRPRDTSGSEPSTTTTPVATPEPSAKPASRPASAAEDELATYGAEDVVSLATRHEQAVSDAPAMVSSLPQEDLRAMNAHIVPDALKMMPGFETSRDVQGFYQIAVRGLRSDPELLVMYDGHALNNPYDGKALVELPTENLERVEALRGPGSALYGTGAFLGVVNLVPVRRDELTATASGDLFTTFQIDAAGGQTWGGFSLHGDADVLHSGGYRAPIASDNFTASLQTPLPNGTQLLAPGQPAGYTDDHHTLANVGGEAKAELGGGHLSLSARGIYEDRGALIGLFDTVGPNSDLTWAVGMVDLRYDHPIGEGSFSVRLYGDTQSVDRLFQLSPADPLFYVGGALTKSTGGLQESTQFTTLNFGGEATTELALGDSNRLTVGLSANEQEMPSFTYKTNYNVDINGDVTFLNGLQPNRQSGFQNNPDVSHRFQGGLFAQDQWRPIKPISIVVGVRADMTQLPTTKTDGTTTEITGTQLVPSISPRAGVVVSATSTLSFKALYGHAFRAPTMQELSDTSGQNAYSEGQPTGNPGLLPATVDTAEVGVEQVVTLSEGKIRLRADGFWNRFSNPILPVNQNGLDVPLLNRSPGVDVKGAEAEARFDASARAGAFVNYSWFHAVDLAAIAPQFALITDVPQYRVNIGIMIPLGGWLNLDLLTQLGAERKNESLSQLQALYPWDIPSYALLMVQVRTEPLWGHWEFALSATNVLQAAYQDDVPRADRIPGLIPEPGFDAMLLVRTRW